MCLRRHIFIHLPTFFKEIVCVSDRLGISLYKFCCVINQSDLAYTNISGLFLFQLHHNGKKIFFHLFPELRHISFGISNSVHIQISNFCITRKAQYFCYFIANFYQLIKDILNICRFYPPSLGSISFPPGFTIFVFTEPSHLRNRVLTSTERNLGCRHDAGIFLTEEPFLFY